MIEDQNKDNVYIDFDNIILDYDVGLKQLGLIEQQFYYSLYHQDVINISEPKKNTVQVVNNLLERYNVVFILKYDVRARLRFINKFFNNVLTTTTLDKHNIGNKNKTNYLIDTESFLNKECFKGTLFYLGHAYCKSTEEMKVIGINDIKDVLNYL